MVFSALVNVKLDVVLAKILDEVVETLVGRWEEMEVMEADTMRGLQKGAGP